MKKILFLFVIIFLFSSCDETAWLAETPKSFYAPENSYQTKEQFRQSLNYLYDTMRAIRFHGIGDNEITGLTVGNDLFYWALSIRELQTWNNYSAHIVAYQWFVNHFWYFNYVLIRNANEILYRLDQPNELSEEDKRICRGEALFFRAYCYRLLAHVYGDVPLSITPINEPKRNFVRTPRAEVYEQCRKDLDEAANLLPNIEQLKDGMVNKQAAQHLLSEVLICLRKYPEAINAAEAVISHQGMALMTERFGSRKNEPGDVYWDLFRDGNYNRSSGNTESILVLQYDYQSPGSLFESYAVRHFIPAYSGAMVESSTPGAGRVNAFTHYTSEKGGSGDGLIAPTTYFRYELWGSDFHNDIRNSSVNITRDFKIDNPQAKGYGQWLVKDGWISSVDTLRAFYPFIMKFSRPGNFPETALMKNSDGSSVKTSMGEHVLLGPASGWIVYKDQYEFRLAETYLLLAEAYIGNNQKDKAAEAVNVVRRRANATPATANEMDIDYILDERARELYIEEFRNITLFRLGKFVERSRKYSPVGHLTGDHQNLWPIPFEDIEKNIEADMEQNPGY
jgi:hypothetical protein